MSVSAKIVAAAATSLVSGPIIPYKLGGHTLTGMDCQGLVRYCVEAAGGVANWTDSNQLARQFLDGELIPITKAAGDLTGSIGLLLAPVGFDTPSRYRDDAFAKMYGDCTHVGVITQTGEVWSVDASASAGSVRTRTERQARACWTHVAKLKGVDYVDNSLNKTASVSQGRYQVYAPSGTTVNLRSKPSDTTDNRVALIPIGDEVVVSEVTGGWAYLTWQGKRGYMHTGYLRPLNMAVTADAGDEHESAVTIRVSRSVARALWTALDDAGVTG